MAGGIQDATELVVRFSRAAAEAKAPGDIWSILTTALISAAQVDACAAVALDEVGAAYVVAAEHVPVGGWRGDAESLGSELGPLLLRASGGRFPQAKTLLLVSGGNLIGAAVLFLADPEARFLRVDVAEALTDIAATALDKAHQYADLRRSYEDLRASRDILARSEKLRLLGQMAAGISHDLMNIFSGISLPVQLLRRELTARNDELTALVEGLEQTVARGVDTVERLRGFSRQAPARTERVRVNDVLREVEMLAKSKLGSARYRSELQFDLGDPPPIMMRASELLNAVMNLVVNAIDAMTAPGTITVISRAVEGQAQIRVIDDGPGIPPEVMKHIFEPFFTTKGETGTGLGLAMVCASVERHQGTLSVDSAPGQGTTFTLLFPGA